MDHLDKKIEEQLKELNVPFTKSKEEAWDQLQQKIEENNTPKSRLLVPKFYKYAAAAILLIAISLSFYVQKGLIEIHTVGMEMKEFKLPDGSLVTINSNSSLEYNKNTWFLSRKVNLEGEAYFEVEKGSDFEVKTESGFVNVLGTKFNVLQKKERFSVSCLEGKVSVSDAIESQSVILTEGLATNLDNDILTEPFEFNKDKIHAWKKGLFYFEKESLSNVFFEIENYYGINIEYQEEVSNKSFSGVFNKSDLKTVLEIVCSPMGLTYSVNEQTVTVN